MNYFRERGEIKREERLQDIRVIRKTDRPT